MTARQFLLLTTAIGLSAGAFADVPRVAVQHATPHRVVHAGKAQTLYDQMGNDSGTGINSQNYEADYDAYDDEAADDFIVPEGAHWKITLVDMAGYYNEGPADSMGVYFYKDKHGKPGKRIAQFTVIPPPYNGNGSFPLDLGRGVKLKPGHYWLSIQANQRFDFAGQWSWATSESTTDNPAMWRNPNGGFELGCTEWTVETTCVDYLKGDHLFALKGKSK